MPSPSRRPRAEQHERLAGVDGDPHLEVVLLPRPVADRERRADGALGIVLVRDRRAEEGHHRVADELLDRAAVPLELAAEPLAVRREQRAHVLRVELLGPRREADEVGEEDRDDLPLLAPGTPAAASAAPQAWQKRASSGFSCPQTRHSGMRRV